MNGRILLCFFAVFSAFLLSFIVGALSVAQNGWFGSGDLWPYAIYSLPFSVLLSAFAFLFFKASNRWPSWLASTVAFLSGTAGGYLGTYTVALLLGPWFGAMSVPMLKSWCVSAGIFVPAFYLIRKHGWTGHSIFGSAIWVAMGAVFFFGISPFMSLATGNQHLMTAFFEYVPGEEELTLEREPEWLSEDDRRLILSCGLKGKLEYFRGGGSNSTQWPRAKAFVIFTSPLSKTTRLPQPKHTSILYVQQEHDFARFPAEAPTFERAIEFYKEESGWGYWVEHSSGAKSGGVLKHWESQP